jgi:hypothetical protein
VIGIALDAGSSRAGKAFSSLMKNLNDHLHSVLLRDYSLQGVEEIVFTLRVSGDVADFGFEGCDRLRERKGRMTMDIGIPIEAWDGAGVSMRAALLVEHVKEAVTLCAGRIRNERRSGNVDRFESDAHQALEEFQHELKV